LKGIITYLSDLLGQTYLEDATASFSDVWKTVLSLPSFSGLSKLLTDVADLSSPSLLPDYVCSIYDSVMDQHSLAVWVACQAKDQLPIEDIHLDVKQRDTLRVLCEYFFLDVRQYEGRGIMKLGK
jgi:hypothetical protein